VGGVWDGEVGEGVCWAGGCGDGEFAVDAGGLGGVCEVGWGVGKVVGGGEGREDAWSLGGLGVWYGLYGNCYTYPGLSINRTVLCDHGLLLKG